MVGFGFVYGYRYGFQGQEKDDEIKGEGNSINYKYRMHDPRIGRFFAVDPLAAQFPHMSPYASFNNNPIRFVDPDGRAPQDWIKKRGSDQWKWDASVTSENNTPDGYDYAAPGYEYDYLSSKGPGTVTLGNGPGDFDLSLKQEVEPDVYASSPYDLNDISSEMFDNTTSREMNNFSQMKPFMVGSDGTLNEFDSRFDTQGMMDIAGYTENFAAGAVMFSGGFVLGGGALLERGLSMVVDLGSQAYFKGLSEINYAQTAGVGLGGFGGATLGATVEWKPFSSNSSSRTPGFTLSRGQNWQQVSFNFVTGIASSKVGGVKANSYSGFDRAITIGGSSFLFEGLSNGVTEGPLKR